MGSLKGSLICPEHINHMPQVTIQQVSNNSTNLFCSDEQTGVEMDPEDLIYGLHKALNHRELLIQHKQSAIQYSLIALWATGQTRCCCLQDRHNGYIDHIMSQSSVFLMFHLGFLRANHDGSQYTSLLCHCPYIRFLQNCNIKFTKIQENRKNKYLQRISHVFALRGLISGREVIDITCVQYVLIN